MGLRAFVVKFQTFDTTFVRIDNPALAPIVGAVPTKAENFYNSALTINTIKEPFNVR